MSTRKPLDPLTEQIQQLVSDTKAAQKRGGETQVEIKEREIRDSEGESRILRRMAERIEPEGTKHVASFSVHIYKELSNVNGQILTISTGLEILPEKAAQTAITELSTHLMRKYGHRPPKKRGDSESPYDIDRTSPDSRLILPPGLKSEK